MVEITIKETHKYIVRIETDIKSAIEMLSESNSLEGIKIVEHKWSKELSNSATGEIYSYHTGVDVDGTKEKHNI